MAGNWMLYGAYGFTGRLIAQEAIRRGHRPILAGRSAEKLNPLADQLNLERRVIGLDEIDRLTEAISDTDLVLHSAGPYSYTSAPMIQACLTAGVHYLDITGEIPVFEHTFSQDSLARRRGISMVSGVGFDVVPSDCLCAYVSQQLPDAVELEVGIAAISSASAGTMKSGLEMLSMGGLIRRQGRLQSQPLGEKVKQIRFADKNRLTVAVSWGDLSTGFRTTGIPNITTYAAYPKALIQTLRRFGMWIPSLVKSPLLKTIAQRWIDRNVQGPSEALREKGRSYVWACARNSGGEQVQAWLETMEAYRLTARVAVRSVEKAFLAAPVGALSPAQLLGANFVLELEKTNRWDHINRG